MTETIKRFGLGTAPGGLRAIYGKTAEGPRIWIVDTADINYLGTTEVVGLLNAGLAAPAMLAALEAVLRWDEEQIGSIRPRTPMTYHLSQTVRAAIAKAKGESE